MVKDSNTDNLNVLAQMPNFNQWVYEMIEPYIGYRVLEVGCGNGRLARKIIKNRKIENGRGCLSYTGIDNNPTYAEDFGRILTNDLDKFVCMDVQDGDLDNMGPFETIICLNLLEHIRADFSTLYRLWHILEPKGRLVIQVPAFPALFGSVDESLQHIRRYTRSSLLIKLRMAGFTIEKACYFNLLGIPAWIWHGKIKKVDVHPEGEMKLGDKLVPIWKWVERYLPLPGISHFVVARK